MSLTAFQVLEKAYALMDTPGVTLAKESYGNEEGQRFCTLGALRMVAFGEPGMIEGCHPNWLGYYEASMSASDHLRVSSHSGHVPSWNDAQERTKDDVLALFRAVAAKVQVEHDGQ